MYRSFNKAERLNKIQIILAVSPDGLSRSVLARRLGVSRATISRDIMELSSECPIREDEATGKLSIDKVSLLNNLRLNVREIQALHLACRLLGRKVRFLYPSASSALRKLGAALDSYASPMARFIIETAGLFESHSRESRTAYADSINRITEGIVHGRVIEFERFSRSSGRWLTCSFEAYCIEPYAEGNSLYLIGFDEGSSEIRTYKLELIRNIHLTERRHHIPREYSMNEYFRSCWGIWTSEHAPQRVVLLFSREVKERVAQTEWHVSESLKETGDGRLEWRADIAEPREMLPWIRGWGPDVEVLEPEWLKVRIAEDLAKAAAVYRSTDV